MCSYVLCVFVKSLTVRYFKHNYLRLLSLSTPHSSLLHFLTYQVILERTQTFLDVAEYELGVHLHL